MGPAPGVLTYSRWRPSLALRISTRAPTHFVLLLFVQAMSIFAAVTVCTYAENPRTLTFLPTTPFGLQPSLPFVGLQPPLPFSVLRSGH